MENKPDKILVIKMSGSIDSIIDATNHIKEAFRVLTLSDIIANREDGEFHRFIHVQLRKGEDVQ